MFLPIITYTNSSKDYIRIILSVLFNRLFHCKLSSNSGLLKPNKFGPNDMNRFFPISYYIG